MKELKLRAYHKTEKKMYKVLTIDWQTGNISLVYDNQSDWEVTRERKALHFERIESVELIQYINKKDINGKDIYEDDIITGNQNIYLHQPPIKGEVKFDVEKSAYVVETTEEPITSYAEIELVALDNLEIVGNAHEEGVI